MCYTGCPQKSIGLGNVLMIEKVQISMPHHNVPNCACRKFYGNHDVCALEPHVPLNARFWVQILYLYIWGVPKIVVPLNHPL